MRRQCDQPGMPVLLSCFRVAFRRRRQSKYSIMSTAHIAQFCAHHVPSFHWDDSDEHPFSNALQQSACLYATEALDNCFHASLSGRAGRAGEDVVQDVFTLERGGPFANWKKSRDELRSQVQREWSSREVVNGFSGRVSHCSTRVSDFDERQEKKLVKHYSTLIAKVAAGLRLLK